MRAGCRRCSSVPRPRSPRPPPPPGSAVDSSPAARRRGARSYEPAPFHAKPARRERAQAPNVSVADRARERVGRIRGGSAREAEEPLHHVLNLILARVPVADHSLLYLERRVLRDRQPRVDRGADRRAARLAERQSRCGIDAEENLLEGDLLGPVLLDHFTQVLENRFQASRKIGGARLDAAACDIGEARAVFLDDPESGDAQTRVDAKYPQGRTSHCPAL